MLRTLLGLFRTPSASQPAAAVEFDFSLKPDPLPELPFDGAGLVSENARGWIMPLVRQADREGWSYDQLERAIRRYGEPVPADEKRALGMRANALLGRLFLECLTNAGRANPMGTSDEIVYRNFMLAATKRNWLQAKAAPFRRMQLLIVEGSDYHACAEARLRANQRFPTRDLPELPLPGCNCRCGCIYVAPTDDEL